MARRRDTEQENYADEDGFAVYEGRGLDDETGEKPLDDDPEDLGAAWLKGHTASDPKDCTAPGYPGNIVWEQTVGESAVAYKTHWRKKPPIFPYGSNDEGGK